MKHEPDLHCVLCGSTNVEMTTSKRDMISHRDNEYGGLDEVIIGQLDVLLIVCNQCGFENDITPRNSIVFQSDDV